MPKNLAIIGINRHADAFLNGIMRLNQTHREKQIHVAAVVDSQPTRAADWVQKNFSAVHPSARPTVLRDWQALLGASKPDLATVLTPHHQHSEVAKPLLEAGVAVQVHKPLGLGIRDSQELIEASEKHKTPLTVCEPGIMGRPNRLLIDWLQSGKQIGTPTLMLDQAVIDLKGTFNGSAWKHLKGMAGAGWMMDHGLSRVHWMIETFGLCVSAYAQTRQLDKARTEEKGAGKLLVDTEDVAAAMLTFQSGLVVQLTVACGGRGLPHKHVQVWGTQGSFHAGKWTAAGETNPRDPELNNAAVSTDIPADPYAHSYTELLARMKNPEAPLVGAPRFAMEAQAVIYACLESSLTGAPVRIDDVLTGTANLYEQTVWSARKALASTELSQAA